MNNDVLKKEVKAYWNKASCGTIVTDQTKHSLSYFEEIEAHRYKMEREIFSFAQFTRHHGKKILEVGVGAGTDFIQWVRAGAHAYGVDLTPEAIANTKARLELYGLQAADLQVADAEYLPYPDNFFDVVYSWGVIHHSPDTSRCLKEIVRVTKPGGTIKIMVYNRYSIFASIYLTKAFLKGKPFQTLSTVIYHHQESLGTKAYTKKELLHLIKKYPLSVTYFGATAYDNDLLYYRRIVRYCAYGLASLLGWWKLGWFMKVELIKEH